MGDDEELESPSDRRSTGALEESSESREIVQREELALYDIVWVSLADKDDGQRETGSTGSDGGIASTGSPLQLRGVRADAEAMTLVSV